MSGNDTKGLSARTKRSAESGFTLVEISVVVFIIAVLFGLGLPTLLGARTRSQDVVASNSLRTASTAGIATSDFRSNFVLASAAELTRFEPSLSYVDGSVPSTGPNTVSVDSSGSDRWVAVVRSDSGTCFAVVIGTAGQQRIEADSCAAADVTALPPVPPTRILTHSGSVTATTNGMCLETVGGFLEQQPCSSSQDALTIETRPDGYSTLSLTDGFCFGTAAPKIAARLVEELCEDADDQLWTIIPAYGETVQFKNKETGYCMDVYGYSSSAGAHIIQWGYGSPPNATCKPTTSPNNHNFGLGERVTSN